MERNYGSEIDGLKAEVTEIKNLLQSLVQNAGQNVLTHALSQNVNNVDTTKPYSFSRVYSTVSPFSSV